ncbi:MAG: bifunctional 3-hydroxydecanoyl-ACP dehydratase/trans-2-decenoyl-ACP isomerase [Gammaproteobacteria bacterium]|jgi:3-hydroxyacyl-[acyl-carrier protein] dehydratase/trans-2-decenoyl-[acyl-carrier protein] isomerase|tara:strand:+ start:2806 stop:3330 length:525 start_codon:yes stop_codon:yes gene_type:complete
MSFSQKSHYTKDELVACSNGELFTNDGDGRLPSDQMLMFDEIINIDDHSGNYDNGSIEATLDINPNLWFFDCHFKEDPVMPGCLGLDAMWQLLGFYLLWTGLPGIGRALGADNIKFFGQVLPSAKKVTYRLDIKRVINRGAIVGLADGEMYVDDKKIYTAEKLKVGLFKDPSNF